MKRLIIAGLFLVFAFSGFAFSPDNNFYDQTQPSLIDKDRFELKIYPNPTETGQVTLEMNKGEISEIRLINIAGKEVVLRKMDFATPKYTLRLDRVPSGIYFVRVKTAENKMVVKKLVVSSH